MTPPIFVAQLPLFAHNAFSTRIIVAGEMGGDHGNVIILASDGDWAKVMADAAGKKARGTGSCLGPNVACTETDAAMRGSWPKSRPPGPANTICSGR